MDFSNFISGDEARELLCELVRIDSTCPGLVPDGAGEMEIARFVADWLEKEGFPAEVIDLGGKRANVVGRLAGSGAPGGRRLMLNGHLDTVGPEGMTIEPFEPRVEGNRVYGLGAFDMKSGIVAALLALKAIKQAGVRLKGDVLFTGVADEEYMSIGTEDIAKRYQADGAVVCEPTGGAIQATHKGFVWLEVTVTGKAAHGSMPQVGVDAIVQAAKFLVAMDKFEKNVLFKRPHHELLTPPSLHASLITGGKELSTYPETCRVHLERRTVPGETAESCRAEIESIIGALAAEDPDFKADVTVNFVRSPLEFREDSLVFRNLIRVIKEQTGQEPVLIGGSGWCDTAILQDAGIPALVYGPAGDGAHAAVEYACLDSIVEAAAVLASLAAEFCGTE
ncbi:MAG: ArgE/DapE family deacylase [bacterium]|jgi:acetylornithine deacetylase